MVNYDGDNYKDFLALVTAQLDEVPCDGMFLLQIVPLEPRRTGIAISACHVSLNDHYMAAHALVMLLAKEDKHAATALLAELSALIHRQETAH